MQSEGGAIELELGVEEYEGANQPPATWLEDRARRRMSLARAFLAEDDWYCDQVRALLADADRLCAAARDVAAGETAHVSGPSKSAAARLQRSQILIRALCLARLDRPAVAIETEVLDEWESIVAEDGAPQGRLSTAPSGGEAA